MTDLNELIYPQVTSVYNKLLQIGVAIILILLILNISVLSVDDSTESMEQHFQVISKQFVAQAVNTSKSLLITKNRQQLQVFVESLAISDVVAEAQIYDKAGQLIAHSSANSSIKQLYGIDPSSIDNSSKHIAFIQEIRDEKLHGYLRLFIVKDSLLNSLQQQNKSQFEIQRIMLLIAIFAGFLLTRGFSRFSRQGMRLGKSK